MAERSAFVPACPACRSALCVTGERARCGECGREYDRVAGIWRCLLDPERFAAWLAPYRMVRAAEGWGSAEASYYRALPRVRADDPQRAIWRVRERHFAELLRRLPESAQDMLDAGAGNGWLAHQLARRGHRVAALDIADDARDGLGAHVHYETRFECYQGEFERLPFAGAQFDWVIFNGALHHAAAPGAALAEARRVVRAGGHVVVMDSPCYADAANGERMVEERARHFAQAYGIGAAAQTAGYLAWPDLRRAAEEAGLRIGEAGRRAGWRERARRAWTERRIGREPGGFPLVVMERGQ